MQLEPVPTERETARLWQGLWRWLVLIPVILALIYACSRTAHIGLGYPDPGEIRSDIHAIYAPWERIVVPPISTAIIQDLPEWQGVSPEDISQSGNVWVEPTITPQLLPVLTPTPSEFENNPRPPTSTSRPSSLASVTPSPLPSLTLTSWLPTATNTLPVTPVSLITFTPGTYTLTPSLTPTRTLTPSLTPTRTVAPSLTPTRTTIITPTASRTLTPTTTQPPIITPTRTPTPTYTSTSIPAPTHTATITLTITYTPSSTFIPTITHTPTITNIPTITRTATPTQPPCGGNIPPGEPDIGLPDGSFASLPCGGLLILDLPALGYNPIDLNTPDVDYDLVFYERKLPSQNNDVVELDFVSVEVGTGPSGACNSSTWYYGFNWGDGVVTNNGHLGNTFPEIDNQAIPTTALYGIPPLQTGIAINLDDLALGIPAGYYPCIRLISPFNWPDNDPSEVDALQILQ